MSLEALKQLPVYYRIEYVSPKLYYFDRTYGDFEKVMYLQACGDGKDRGKIPAAGPSVE